MLTTPQSAKAAGMDSTWKARPVPKDALRIASPAPVSQTALNAFLVTLLSEEALT